MDEISQLEDIQQELKAIGEKLGNLFLNDHPNFDDVFEDMGEAGYYIEEAGYRLKATIKTLQGKGETEQE